MCQWIIVGCFLGAVHFIFCQMDKAWQNSDWAKDSVIRKQIIVLRASQIARINNDFKMDVIKHFFFLKMTKYDKKLTIFIRVKWPRHSLFRTSLVSFLTLTKICTLIFSARRIYELRCTERARSPHIVWKRKELGQVPCVWLVQISIQFIH